MSAHLTRILFRTCLASCPSLVRLTADPCPGASVSWASGRGRGERGRGEREERERGEGEGERVEKVRR